MAVQKGDVVFLPKSANGAALCSIKWRQDQYSFQADYYLLQGTVSTTGDYVGVFVLKRLYDAQRLHAKGTVVEDKLEVRIDDSFQYGEKMLSGEGRFLVFHDKAYKPDQTCFGLGAARAFGNSIGGWADVIPIHGWGNMINACYGAITTVVGDRLKDF